MIQNSFYEELEQVFDHGPNYHTKILLEDNHAKLRKQNIFKLTVGNESLHLIRIDNIITKFATTKKSAY